MIMKKIVLAVLALLVGSVNLFAGDVATFVDCGFSADGKYYVFGQYGKTDKEFQGWADIYQVDIEKNDYFRFVLYYFCFFSFIYCSFCLFNNNSKINISRN